MPIGSSHRRFSPWARVAGVAAVGAVLLYVTVVFGIAQITSSSRPAVALRFYPQHSEALSEAALAALQGQDAGSFRKAESLAKRAVSVSPLSVGAIRTLGLIAGVRGQQQSAEALMHYALALSRRDFGTHLWFIEKSVADEDVPGALAHYDKALKTSRTGRTILLPVLAGATANASLIRPIADILALRPNWMNPFFKEMVASAPSLDNVLMLIGELEKRGISLEQPEQARLAARLLSDHRYIQAARLLGRPMDASPIMNADFRDDRDFGQFSWKLRSTYDVGASRRAEVGPDGDFALAIFARHEAGGEVARQLLLLPPGRYKLSEDARGIPRETGERPYWVMTCANDGRELMREALAGDHQATEADQPFEVPVSECGAQWLRLVMRPSSNPDGVDAVVQKVRILPV